jgi:hypothetical protein
VICRLPLEFVQQLRSVLLELALENVSKVRLDKDQHIFQSLVSCFSIEIPVDDAELFANDIGVLVTASWLHQLLQAFLELGLLSFAGISPVLVKKNNFNQLKQLLFRFLSEFNNPWIISQVTIFITSIDCAEHCIFFKLLLE